MKKGLLLVVVMLATIAVKAQDIYVGGSLNVWRNSTGNLPVCISATYFSQF